MTTAVKELAGGIASYKHLDVPTRLLLGPGPSNMPPRVNLALAAPMIGYADPDFFKVLTELVNLIRYIFQTSNELTFPITGAGSAAMEACLANLVEPGDVVLVGVAGYFAERIYEMAGKYGADRRRLEREWGSGGFTVEEIKEGLEKHKPKLLCLIHGETSTGVIQNNIKEIGQLCKEHGTLLMVDTVASLLSTPFFVDDWGVDACYTGGQKCLSGPPGISPITFSPAAVAKIKARKTPIANWYLDTNMLAEYWVPAAGAPRKYHHTPATNLIYALREALLVVAEEGLENVWERHKQATSSFYDGLEKIGLKPLVADVSSRVPSLTTVSVPEGVDSVAVAAYLLEHFNIEIAKGLGPLLGKVWRVGLMGYNARVKNSEHLLFALEQTINYTKKQKSSL